MELKESRDGMMIIEATTLAEYLEFEDLVQYKYAKRVEGTRTKFEIQIPKIQE